MLKDGLNFYYRKLIEWDNSKPLLEEAYNHNEHMCVRASEEKNLKKVNIKYPGTLTVFQRENVEYKHGDLKRYVISKAYVLNEHIIHVINERKDVITQCEWHGIKKLNIVFVN